MDGIIFDIQRACLRDGPGIRTTVFLKGCPLSCVWCHNPESQSFKSEVMFYREKCTACGRCRNLALSDSDFICYNDAKRICGKAVSSDEVVAEILKDKAFYQSTGGVTLSGGEPLAQYEFSFDILKKSKENSLNTAIETSGYSSAERIIKISPYVDLFLFDYKETDLMLHKRFTGVGNIEILENLRLIDALGKEIILRCPIIPGYNDRQEHFEGICRIANSLKNIIRIELEPYHPLGESKYAALNREAISVILPDEIMIKGWLENISGETNVPVKMA